MTFVGMLFQYLYGRFLISGATNDGKLNASGLAIPLYFKGTSEGGLCSLDESSLHIVLFHLPIEQCFSTLLLYLEF